MKYLKKGTERTAADRRRLTATVAEMIEDVRTRGDESLREYSRRFDGCERLKFRVTEDEIRAALSKLTEQEKEDLTEALHNIRAFAEAQKATVGELPDFSPRPGIHLGHRVLPVDSCLCYVPGGRFPLYSTALMLITPAKAAGVRRVAACAPAVHGTDQIHYRTLAAMAMAGADEIYVLGGSQAIAAFSYGTESIDPVDVIVGPGNQYVAEAKRQCYGQVGIDFVAGPSEVLVIADGAADPARLAADLLAQCEHDPNAKAILVTTEESLGKRVMEAVEAELAVLPTAETARASWETFGEVLLADSLEEAAELSNRLAPEHLEVNTGDPEALVPKLTNYGSLFLGGNTAEVFGDYASGTNHTLPTIRASRYTGGVWVGTFLKVCTHQSMTPEASAAIAPMVQRMAEGEGLMGHARAAELRKNAGK